MKNSKGVNHLPLLYEIHSLPLSHISELKGIKTIFLGVELDPRGLYKYPKTSKVIGKKNSIRENTIPLIVIARVGHCSLIIAYLTSTISIHHVAR